MPKINPYYIVKRAFNKRADSISMQFEPSSTPTWSLDNLANTDPAVQKTPWQATEQHPAIKDINQRYSSRIYGPVNRYGSSIPRWNLDSLITEGKPYITEEQAHNILTGVRNNDLLMFLLSRGYPTRQEPYIANVQTEATDNSRSSFMGVFRFPKAGRPAFGHISTNPLELPSSGHEGGHSADMNDKLDYDPAYRHLDNYMYSNIPSFDVLRAETAATLGHYAALKRALSDRPDLYERYVQLSAPSLIPALGTYYVSYGPNAIRELGSVTGGVANTVAGMTNPANWNKKGLQHLFRQGRRMSHKWIGKPEQNGKISGSPWQYKSLKWLNNMNANAMAKTNSTQEPWKSLVDEMRTYAKKKYGFNNSIQWYNPHLSPAENVGFGIPQKEQKKYIQEGYDPSNSPLLNEINIQQQ